LLQGRVGRTRDRLEALGRRAGASLQRLTGPRRTRLERAAGRLSLEAVRRQVTRSAERAEALGTGLSKCILNALDRRRRQLDGSAKLLASLSYHGVLQRGFALVRDSQGRSVRSAAQVTGGQRLDIELADGHVAAEATGDAATPDRSRPTGAATPARRRPARQGGSQGSLF
jgi:exodeoxyribonuclease VII large subunit